MPTFSELANMTQKDSNSPVATAATAQVKLCPYDEEEPHIWFCLIEAQFSAAGIKSQKLKYANALASLPKQVLRDILDTLDVCNDSDEPFEFLKNTLLGQFGKSKWQSYFELLCLPMEMQGLKSSVLMGKLKQHLPPGVSPDIDLFLAMFLIRLFTFFFSGAATRWSLNRFPTQRGGFCMPGTGGAITPTGTATEVGSLTSSPPSRGQSSGEPCGHLPTPQLTVLPVGVYSITVVQYLYISCYLSDNKPVLSYLLLHLLPHTFLCYTHKQKEINFALPLITGCYSFRLKRTHMLTTNACVFILEFGADANTPETRFV